MSAEEQKPAVAAEAATVEPTPAPAGVVSEDKPAEAVEPKPEEAPKAEAEPAATAAAEAPKEEKKEEKPVEPIYSGALGYKAPGLKNAFRFSKKYFWFGEDPVPASSLNQYLRGEKAEVAHPVAAWSSVTGKGLIYFVKHADQKETPAGVLNLAEVTELTKDGTIAFHFKLHGGKHTFEAQTAPERNGWFVAFEKAVEEAKAKKEEITSGDAYKEQLEKLGKPATLAATTAKEGSTPKKSTDAVSKPAEGEAGPAEGAPARTGSSSSSSSDEDKKKKKAKSKSRSVSRGKRASIFGGILGKKDKTEEKAEEKKEEPAEGKKEETPAAAAAAPAGEPSTAAPVTEEAPKPVEEAKAEETPAEAPKTEEKPKPTKRGSIFGTFVEKLKSPTHEKKEADVAPPPPAKEPEAAEAPKPEETPAPPAPAAEVAEAPKAEETKETKPTTPHKEKQHFSFGKFLGGAKEKVKSPTTEKAPEAPKTEEAPKPEETTATATEPAAEVPPKEEAKEEAKKEEPAAEASTPATKKRGSIFGSFGGSVKKDKEGGGEHKGLGGLFRNASKAGKSKKEKETATTPPKVEETAEPKEEAAAAPAAPTEAKKEETPAAPAEPASIGDVVPEAVQVGQAPKSTPEVATTA